jgi:hypothetical protein
MGQSACSLKEAAIVASVLSKVSVPMLHSAAALARLAQMDYSGKLLAPIPRHEAKLTIRSKLALHPYSTRQEIRSTL